MLTDSKPFVNFIRNIYIIRIMFNYKIKNNKGGNILKQIATPNFLFNDQ